MGDLRRGLYGCPLCNEPPPHGHDLGVVLNAKYYCPDGIRHEWVNRRWRRPGCRRCGRVPRG
jgi:hypothetical protein